MFVNNIHSSSYTLHHFSFSQKLCFHAGLKIKMSFAAFFFFFCKKKIQKSCNVSKIELLTFLYYRWKLNGTIVDLGMDYRYSVVEGSLLINNPNKTQDAGTYQCIATNSFGTIVSREAKLQFACK